MAGVLRAQWTPAQTLLEWSKCCQRRRKEDVVVDRSHPPACTGYPVAHLGGADQMCIGVEGAVANGMKRQRIERVMLEDHKSTARVNQPTQFGKPSVVLFVRNVMEHTGGEDKVEAL